jgi:tRNA (guanine37-N1)-methyltransferase
MLAAKCPKKDAQKTKIALLRKGLIDNDHKTSSDRDYVYFPIKKKARGITAVDMPMERLYAKETSLKDAVKDKLSKEELKILKTAFDMVGDIAILEIDFTLKEREKMIADTLLSINKNIKTVLRKSGGHAGEFRTQKMDFLAGEDKREALHKENNIRLKLDVERVYFSPRLSTERKRVMLQVKKGERILVMFSGCGPYVCVLSKNTKASEVIGVEINPVGHEYAQQNIALNKLKNASVHLGDVTEIVPTLGKFDRILMPLPKGAGAFLDIALAAAEKKCTIHFYDFLKEGEEKLAYDKIKAACKAAGRKCTIKKTVKCGQSAPREYRVCVDFALV